MWEKVAIIGGGESGVGAALLASHLGKEVFLSDGGPIKEKYKQELLAHNIPFEEKGHTIERLKSSDVIIKSPGVPGTVPLIIDLKKLGIPVVSEIEYGYHYYDGKIIGITGSNGKTTTTGMLGHVLKEMEADLEIGGNIGESFCRIICDRQPKWMVLELSSFQLDDIIDFRPDIAILLNITPDHLDRYGYSLENYARAKFRLIENQQAGDVFIYNGDDTEIVTRLPDEDKEVTRISIRQQEYIDGVYSQELTRNFDIRLIGRHNLFNACCVIKAIQTMGCTDVKLDLGLKTFRNLPHRLETIVTSDGVSWINDSKATNVDAVFYALEAVVGPVIWIAGGVDKGNDYAFIEEVVHHKVRALICLGIDNQKLIDYFSDQVTDVLETDQVDEAIKMASALAEPGGTVLLSPACASFDLFKNYIDRGDQFREAVTRLIG